MGYYTKYKLEIFSNESNLSDKEVFDLTISYLEEFDILNDALSRNLDTYDSTKWYENESDMRKISQLIPDVLFLLEGEGEESGDIWKKYFMNGKMQNVKQELCLMNMTKVNYHKSQTDHVVN